MKNDDSYAFLFERLENSPTNFQEQPFLQLPPPHPPCDNPSHLRREKETEEDGMGIIIIQM